MKWLLQWHIYAVLTCLFDCVCVCVSSTFWQQNNSSFVVKIYDFALILNVRCIQESLRCWSCHAKQMQRFAKFYFHFVKCEKIKRKIQHRIRQLYLDVILLYAASQPIFGAVNVIKALLTCRFQAFDSIRTMNWFNAFLLFQRFAQRLEKSMHRDFYIM